MTRARAALLLGSAALLAAGGFVLYRLKVKPDASWRRTVERAATEDTFLWAELARETHRGPPPCLRYAERDVTPTEAEKVADTVMAAGLQDRLGTTFPLLWRWAQEREEKSHARDEASELTAHLAAGLSPLGRVYLWLHRRRIRPLAPGGQPAARLRASAAAIEHRLAPEVLRKLRAVWEQHPRVLSLAGLMHVIPVLKRRQTEATLEKVAAALTAWARQRGAFPVRIAQLGLPRAQLLDAWGEPLHYEPGREAVRVLSRGADRSIDGLGPTDDLERAVRLTEALAISSAPMLPGCDRPPPAQNSVARKELTGALADPKRAVAELRLVPHVEGGKPVGVRVGQAPPGSLWARLGLCAGDVVEAVQGVRLEGPASADEAHRKVKGAPRVTFDVLRAGQRQRVTVAVK